MSSSAFYNEKMLSYYNTADGKKLYDLLTQEAVQSFPQYVEEIQGLADGIELPFYKVSLSSLRQCSEYDHTLVTPGTVLYNGLQAVWL